MLLTKVQFLEKMFSTAKNRQDILDFLVQQLALTDDERVRLLHEDHSSHAVKIANLLEDLQKSNKLNLVDYEWTMLPEKMMKLTIVGSTDKKEFVSR